MDTHSNLASLAPSFAQSAQLAGVIEQIQYTAPILLKEKGFCLLIFGPESRKAFDDWQQRDRFSPYNHGTATFGSGFFGLRIPDDPAVIQDMIAILDLAESGRYLVAHRPGRTTPGTARAFACNRAIKEYDPYF